jgi:FAD/FMN-containing dehydrogenase
MLPLPPRALELEGEVLTPGDPGYDEARAVYNGAVDRRPALIARVAGAADVARAIAYARETGAPLAVRGGGHSLAGHGVVEDGVVIDLRALRGLQIDAGARSAWAETGLTAGDYTTAAATHGLATGFGDTGAVGLGGITLAGGIGFLVRKHGMTIDDLLGAEVVTAGGELVHADHENHPDLFWALRGGGGNFGVVTRMRFRLHELRRIVGGMLFLPATPDTIAGFMEAAAAAPDELSAIAGVMTAPPLPFIPAALHGRLVVMGTFVWSGDVAEGERVLAPFRALAEPLADLVRPMAYPEIYPPDDDYRPTAVIRTGFAPGISRSAAETILEHLEASTAPMRVVQLRALGGAMARVPAGATAFAHRDAGVMVNVLAMYAEDRPVHEAWVRGLAAELMDGDGAYAGFLADDGEAGARAAYPGATYERLADVKARYDPDNVFRLNQNVRPAAR